MRLSKWSNFGGEPADDDRCSTLLHSIALVQGKLIINGNQCVIDTATCQKYPWQPIHSRIAAWLPGKSAVSEAKPVSLMTTYLGESDIKWPTLGRHRHRTVAAGLFTDLVHLWTPAQRATKSECWAELRLIWAAELSFKPRWCCGTCTTEKGELIWIGWRSKTQLTELQYTEYTKFQSSEECLYVRSLFSGKASQKSRTSAPPQGPCSNVLLSFSPGPFDPFEQFKPYF
jgi:hypothetical protein